MSDPDSNGAPDADDIPASDAADNPASDAADNPASDAADSPASDTADPPVSAPAFTPDDGRRHESLGDAEWTVLDSEVEYETGWFTAGYDLVEQPNGSTKQYYWAELATAVVVVAVADDSVVFVEQYRPTVRETQLELPAGIVEEGESYTTAGARELREETGFEPSSTALLQDFWCCTGALRHRRAFVFAEGLEPVGQDLDDNEFLSVHAVPVEEALEVARAQPTNDATVEGLLLARDEGLL